MKQGLVIIDVQNDYFPQGKFTLVDTERVLNNILTIQKYFSENGLPIFYIQHIKLDPNAAFFAKGSHGADIHPDLLASSNQYKQIIQKSYPNSFFQTDLQQKLQQQNVKQLVICGMMSHMCIDSTTRCASELGYQPILIDDACTTRDLEFNGEWIPAKTVHNSFMSALMNFAFVISCEQFIEIS